MEERRPAVGLPFPCLPGGNEAEVSLSKAELEVSRLLNESPGKKRALSDLHLKRGFETQQQRSGLMGGHFK